MGMDPYIRLRHARRTLTVHSPRTAAVVVAVAVALATAAACASSPAPPGSGSGPATLSVTAHASVPAFLESSTPASQSTASQSGSGLVSRLLDAQSVPSGYQMLPASAFTVPTGSATTAPACSSEAFGNPYGALTTVHPVEVAERGIDGPDESSGYFWRGSEQLFGYQGAGAQNALAALRQWVTRCSQPQPGGATVGVSIGTGPKLGDESLTLHVSMSVRISSGAAVAPFDSIIVRTGAVVFVLSEQGVPTTNGAGDNAARLTAVANAAYAQFQHS